MTTSQQKHRTIGSAGTSIRSLFSLTSLAILLASWSAGAVAKDNLELARKNRVIEFQDSAVRTPSGLAYSPEADAFFVGQPSKGGFVFGKNYKIQKISSLGDNVRSFDIWAPISNPVNTAFDAKNNQLLILSSFFSDELIIVKTNQAKNLNPNVLTRHSLKHFSLNNPQGITLNPKTGTLYILDAADQQIVVIEPGPGSAYVSDAVISTIDLNALSLGELRGIAFNPENGHLYVLNPVDHNLHELTKQGAFILTRDLTNFALSDSRGMVFAPSGDQTDDKAEMSLYIANTGLVTDPEFIGPLKGDALVTAGIVELSLLPIKLQENTPLSLAPIALEASPDITAILVNTILTSEFDPVSPDPSGITYLPNGNLLECDGEVNEMSVYADVNLFELTLSGTLVDTSTTVEKDRKHEDGDDHPQFPDHPWGFTDEPTGMSSVNPANNHVFFTTDGSKGGVFEIDPGSDSRYGTADDTVVSKIDAHLFSAGDAEGVAFNPVANELFLAGGIDNEVYRIKAGDNGQFGDADDIITQFDTEKDSSFDPEGIVYNPNTGTLYVVGDPNTTVFEYTLTGGLVRKIDISAALLQGLDKPAGLALAPGSENPSELSLYIVDRGIDNNRDPNENDGKIYEFSFGAGASGGNQAPVVNAGGDQTISSDTAVLNASVIDDGIPSVAQTTWSKVGGPGTVVFGDLHSEDTTANFSENGTYTLRLTANDTKLFDTDDIVITVNETGHESGTLDVKVTASADDAEEKSDGNVSLSSSDLELVHDGSNQTVGMRFNGISIPSHATITDAYIQFQADEANSGAATLKIEGEATSNPSAFSSSNGNISSRPRTGAKVNWSPDDWGNVGEQGSKQRTPNLKSIIQETISRSGWNAGNSLAILITGSGERTAESFNGSSSAAPALHIEYTTGPVENQAPNVDAGVNQTIGLSGSTTLNGTVSDDGLPNATPTTLWTKVSGVGTVTFGSSSSADTTVNFSAPGTYILKLTANDGELATSDNVTVIVTDDTPVNQAPVVNAGIDQTITLPNLATLNATLTDDGLPNTAQTTWTKVSGPGTVQFTNASKVDTTASFSAKGTYTLRLTANDTELSDADDIVVTVNEAGTGNTSTFEVRVLASEDDAEEKSLGGMKLTSSDLELVNDGGNQTVGVRFNHVVIPQHATITSAYIQYQADEINSGSTALAIEGEAVDDAVAFTSTDGNISSRNKTNASVAWSPAAWTEKNVAGIDQQTSDISLIIQEIVNRAGWVSDNSLVIITTGVGERTAESFDGNSDAAPLLHIEYSTGPITNQAPHVNAGANQTIHLPNTTVTLNATVSDDGLPGPASTLWTKVSGPSMTFGNPNNIDTTADFSVEGTYVLRLTADDTEFSDFDELTIVVEPQGTQVITVERRVTQSTDDAEERSDGSVKLSSSDLELVFDKTRLQTVGVRFNDIDIPKSATITNAYIQYQVDEEKSDDISLIIKGEASDNAVTFNSDDGDITTRNVTSANVVWNPVSWGTKNEADIGQRTEDISSIIQEIIDRNGWSAGHSLAIITTRTGAGTGTRVAESYDGDTAAAPLLHIEYR